MYRERSGGNHSRNTRYNDGGMWVGDSEESYDSGGRNVRHSVGGYLEENSDSVGGYGQDDDYYNETSRRGQRGNQRQKGMRRGQQGLNNQGNMMGRSGMMGGSQSMMRSKQGMSGRQGGMMGGESGMMGNQGGMMGNQGGMMGNQMGMMGQGQQMGGASNSELVELLKKQSEVISKLTERIGLDKSTDYEEDDGYDDGYGVGYDTGYDAGYDGGYDDGYGGGYGGSYSGDYYEEDYSSYVPMRRGGRRGRPYRRRPMRGGPMRGPGRGGYMPQRGNWRDQGGYGGMGGPRGKRQGDYQRDFGGKKPRVDSEGRVKKARSGYAVMTPEQKLRRAKFGNR